MDLRLDGSHLIMDTNLFSPLAAFLLIAFLKIVLGSIETTIFGLSTTSNSPSLLTTVTVRSRLECSSVCAGYSGCTGINFSGTSCKIQSGSANIGDYGIRSVTGQTPCIAGGGAHQATLDVNGQSHTFHCLNDWIVMLSRGECQESFERGWDDYKNGFGSLATDYWLGLEKVYQMTSSEAYELKVEVQAPTTSQWYNADYSPFSLANEANYYALNAIYTGGTAADKLGHGLKFYTSDHANGNTCPGIRRNGWWFSGCSWGNLAGACSNQDGYVCGGGAWVCYIWQGVETAQSLKAARILIRPLSWRST